MKMPHFHYPVVFYSRSMCIYEYTINKIMLLIVILFHFSIKGSLSQYLPESRNFLKSDRSKQGKHRYLHKGKENIINFLDKLPKTKHDLGSFIVDVPMANVSNLLFKLFFFKVINYFFISGSNGSDST